jgi:hypothetical protein
MAEVVFAERPSRIGERCHLAPGNAHDYGGEDPEPAFYNRCKPLSDVPVRDIFRRPVITSLLRPPDLEEPGRSEIVAKLPQHDE